MSGRRLAWVAVLFLLLASGCGSGASATPRLVDVPIGTVATYEFTIPAGTGERIDRGQAVNVLPEDLHVHVGQTIRIRNLDNRGHLAGPFFVGAGQVLTQRFTHAGTISGRCSVHLSGTFELQVDK